jgi:hypothetical protein
MEKYETAAAEVVRSLSMNAMKLRVNIFRVEALVIIKSVMLPSLARPRT